jgi:large subunit ribosomal protein L9
MRIILLEDVKNLGKKNEIKDVSDGYGRNFLLKNKLAKLATERELLSVEKRKEAEAVQKQKEVAVEKELAQKIKSLQLEIKMKVGEKEELFESVNAQKIAEKMQEEGYEINEKNIIMEESLKKLGEHEVEIKLKHGEKTSLKFNIIKQK